jgi:hypothetical protein
MADKSTILRTFNTNFFDFFNEILTIYPNNPGIMTGKNAFEMAKKANPTILIKVWYSFIYSRYHEVIDSGDITFIYEKDYGEDVGHLGSSKTILEIIDSLREPIRSMSDENKAHSMQYMQVLSRLSEVYHDLTK